jgi:type IV pilus assembly protein PilV
MHNKGFTLIELVVAIVIFAIGIVGVVKLQMAAVAGNAYSQNLSQALTVAQNEVEFLQSLDYNRTHVPAELSNGGHNLTAVTSSQGITFQRGYTVAQLAGVTDALDVHVFVAWMEKWTTHGVTIDIIRSAN